MVGITDLELAKRAVALQSLVERRQQDMARRWPEIDFDAEVWPIKSLYKTRMTDVRFSPTAVDFSEAEASYMLALRCLVAAAALDGKIKFWKPITDAWRLLAADAASQVALTNLQRYHLRDLEGKAVKQVHAALAHPLSQRLSVLSRQLDYLAREGVVDRLRWNPALEIRERLRKQIVQRQGEFKAAKAAALDRQIEGFSEATSAMLRGDDRLNARDRSAIAATNILMCAPSRINEPLCLGIGDRYTVESYSTRSESPGNDEIYRTHQLLFMKGSKGAQWSAKPVLNFMVALSDTCWQVLLDGGKRSRELITWYEQHPDRLYLPRGLEHFRGKPVSVPTLWQIVNLTTTEATKAELGGIYTSIWKPLVTPENGDPAVAVVYINNPRARDSNGKKASRKLLHALPWQPVEAYLLRKVHERLRRLRRVTPENHYEGKLSEMLMLIDSDVAPYLPQGWTDGNIRERLKCLPSRAKKGADPSVFVKLGLRMIQQGEEVDCYLAPHDTRRWLTSQALLARERVSDVLINKWANRLSVDQLVPYDLRTEAQKAEQAAMPAPPELVELSRGLQELESLELRYGLSTDVVVAHGNGIAVTSLEAVCEATENRPVARSGNQLIILYPTRFGMCVHQHHEIPCRSYKCNGCDSLIAIKGHAPTNDQWRREAELANRSIVNQLHGLITARNRGIADDPMTLDAHLLNLVGQGLDPQAMTTELVERFHEFKDQIADPNFKRALEQAFVASGVVKRLDDPNVSSGALIKYHNPSQHASPGYERAVEGRFGGREEMDRASHLFYQENAEFAPSHLGLSDETQLAALNDSEHGDVSEKAA